MKYPRYIQIQAVATITKTKGRGQNKQVSTITTQIPTFFLDKDVQGIFMKDAFTPEHPLQLAAIVESIVNPFHDDRIAVSFQPMVCHSEFQPEEIIDTK